MVERIHFFRHDVGGGTQGTVKQGPVVKGRGFDFRDAMLFYRGLKKSFQVPPFAVGGVEGVVGAAWGVEGGGWGFGAGEESTKEGVKGALELQWFWLDHVLGCGYTGSEDFELVRPFAHNRRLAQAAKGDKIFLLFIMLLFPSIANKSFTVFRCRKIPGLEYTVLDEDFSVVCWEGQHITYVVVACLSIAVCKWVWHRGGCGCANVSNISLLFLSLQMPSVYHCTCSSNCTAIDVIFTPPMMVL